MRKSYCFITGAFCLSLLVCAPAPTLGGGGETGTKGKQAKELMDKAQVLYSYGDYKGALENYMSAFELVQDNMLHYEIGLCYMKLGEWARAADEFEKYVVGEGEGIDSQVAGEISVLLEDITRKIGVIYMTVETAGAEVTVDASSHGKTPLKGGIFVEPGEHEIKVSAAGLVWSKSLEIKAGETMELEVKNSDLAFPEGAQAAPPAVTKTGKKEKKISRSYAYAALSLTLATLVGASIGGGLALKDAGELEDLDRRCQQEGCNSGDGTLYDQYAASKEDVFSRADAEAKTSTALFAISGAFAVATILLFVFSRPGKELKNDGSSEKVTTSFLPGAEGFVLKVNF